MRTPIIRLVLVAGLAALGQAAEAQLPGLEMEGPAPNERTPEEVIRDQLAAFNAHDVDALVANLAGDFAWFAVDSDVMTVEMEGREPFYRSMRDYFDQVPGARAEIEDMVVVGEFATVRERAYWNDGIEEYSQAALAVYEIREGLIRRVWYYPAVE